MSANHEPRYFALSALLLLASLSLTVWLLGLTNHQQQLKRDHAELSHVKYGMLNAERWVEQIAEIVERRVNEFAVTPENRAQIHHTVASVIDRLIVEVDKQLRRQRKQGSIWDRLKGGFEQVIQDSLIDFKALRRNVPQYTDQILDELQKPENKRQIKELTVRYLQEISQSTFSSVEMAPYEQVLQRYRCDSEAACKQRLSAAMNQQQHLQTQLAGAIWICVLLILWLAFRYRNLLAAGRSSVLILSSVVMLIVGLYAPMIEVEARVSEFSVSFYGEQIRFADQLLYFQSKSILDVVALLIQSLKPDLMLVGALIGLFSVLFPVGKLLASFIYYFNLNQWRERDAIQFFALKSGKWSMADVFVIAIFMAYLGFDGIITSQLSELAEGGENLDLLTTNGTEIEVGFFMFLGFCLTSLLTSHLIEVEQTGGGVRDNQSSCGRR